LDSRNVRRSRLSSESTAHLGSVRVQVRRRPHTHAHTHTHARAHTHSHTHTHTHTLPNFSLYHSPRCIATSVCGRHGCSQGTSLGCWPHWTSRAAVQALRFCTWASTTCLMRVLSPWRQQCAARSASQRFCADPNARQLTMNGRRQSRPLLLFTGRLHEAQHSGGGRVCSSH
jgi:hypothetical protein